MTDKPTKKPIIGALLNLFPLVMGIGYIYIGNPLRFVAVFGLQILGPILLEYVGFANISNAFLIILYIGSIIDVYRQAKAISATNE